MARAFLRLSPVNLALIPHEQATLLHPAPAEQDAQESPDSLAVRGLPEAALAGTVRLRPRQRVLATHLAFVTLMSVAALVGVLAR
ncbi:MAG TPA: hypothetical protein VIW01_11570 [Dehalococcoidia bacterium]